MSLVSAKQTFEGDPYSPLYTLEFGLVSEPGDPEVTYAVVLWGEIVSQTTTYLKANGSLTFDLPHHLRHGFLVNWREEAVRIGLERIKALVRSDAAAGGGETTR